MASTERKQDTPTELHNLILPSSFHHRKATQRNDSDLQLKLQRVLSQTTMLQHLLCEPRRNSLSDLLSFDKYNLRVFKAKVPPAMPNATNDVGCTNILRKIKNKINNFGDQSSLHGIGHIFSMERIPFFKRLFWLIIVSCCCLGASAILRSSLLVHSGDVISYSVETNYLNFDTPFPAVTICESQGGVDRVKPFLVKNGLPTTLTAFMKENLYWNLKYCKTCSTCKINQTCSGDYIELVEKLRFNCSEILSDCWWAGQHFNCCDRFLPIQTEYGKCFVFNSALTTQNNTHSVNLKVGLPDLVFIANQTILWRLHAPDDIVSVFMDNILGVRLSSLPLITDCDVILKAEQIISEPSLISLPVNMRKCFFRHERPPHATMWRFKYYTYNNCLLYCKAKAQVDVCNCTHHFIPKLGNYPSCDIAGSGCLHINRDLINVKCDCAMGCEETNYKAVHIHNFRHDGKKSPELMLRGTRVTVKFAGLPTLRVLRHAIRDTMGLVVDIGGVGGVFFGASLLSVIEIIYLLFIRREAN